MGVPDVSGAGEAARGSLCTRHNASARGYTPGHGQGVADNPRIYCRHCSYDLRGQVDPRCPECGRGFDPGDARTFRRRPGRAWVRTIVRSAIVLLLLAACAFTWFYYDWRREQAAVEYFKAHTGWVEVARVDVPVLSKLVPRRYDWIFDRVRSVCRWNAVPSPEHLRLAASCRRLEELDVLDCSVELTSAGVDALAGLPRLQFLSLQGPALDNDALRKLERLTQLKNLVLGAGPFTPAAVQQLRAALPGCNVRSPKVPTPPATNPAGRQAP